MRRKRSLEKTGSAYMLHSETTLHIYLPNLKFGLCPFYEECPIITTNISIHIRTFLFVVYFLLKKTTDEFIKIRNFFLWIQQNIYVTVS